MTMRIEVHNHAYAMTIIITVTFGLVGIQHSLHVHLDIIKQLLESSYKYWYVIYSY